MSRWGLFWPDAFTRLTLRRDAATETLNLTVLPETAHRKLSR
jgi:hypothetical protein